MVDSRNAHTERLTVGVEGAVEVAESCPEQHRLKCFVRRLDAEFLKIILW